MKLPAELPKSKTPWILGGLFVVVLIWFAMRRGGGAQVIPGTPGGPSDAQTAAAGQGFQALAGAVGAIESAREVAAAQLAQTAAEASSYLEGQRLQAGAVTAAADRQASAQKASYVWGTIRDIGVTAIPFLFGGHSGQGSSAGGVVPQYGGGAGPGATFI